VTPDTEPCADPRLTVGLALGLSAGSALVLLGGGPGFVVVAAGVVALVIVSLRSLSAPRRHLPPPSAPRPPDPTITEALRTLGHG
jgi:uncharacterized membrane protein YjjP (DUF1212 family)